MNNGFTETPCDIFDDFSPIPLSPVGLCQTERQSIVSETVFISWATRRNFYVTHPIFHSQPFDFVIKTADGWKTVQVKTATWQVTKRGAGKGGIRDRLKLKVQRYTGNGKRRAYQDGDFDYLFVVDGDSYWFIPWDAIKNQVSLTLAGPKWSHYRVEI